MKKIREVLHATNGWQRLFLLVSIFWSLFVIAVIDPFPTLIPTKGNAEERSVFVREQMAQRLPNKPWDKYQKPNFEKNPTLMLNLPSYREANQATKRALFDKYVLKSAAYTTANTATRQAIEDRFGITSERSQDLPLEDRIVDPHQIEAVEGVDHIPNQYEMDDGTVLESSTPHPKERVVQAYAEVKKELEAENARRLKECLLNFGSMLLIPLAGLYLLGWFIGWIYRGFKKAD